MKPVAFKPWVSWIRLVQTAPTDDGDLGILRRRAVGDFDAGLKVARGFDGGSVGLFLRVLRQRVFVVRQVQPVLLVVVILVVRSVRGRR